MEDGGEPLAFGGGGGGGGGGFRGGLNFKKGIVKWLQNGAKK